MKPAGQTSSHGQGRTRRVGRMLVRSAAGLPAVAAMLVVVGLLQGTPLDLSAMLLLYQIPIIFTATHWGFGPSFVASVVAILSHDRLFVGQSWELTPARIDELLELALLLLTSLVTARLADAARRGAEKEREAEVALRSDQLKTSLLRAVSHDLRTPLASIKAGASTLRETGTTFSDEDRSELLAAVEEEADRLDRLVANLLDASRLEAGVLKPHTRPQDLAELVDAVTSRLRPVLAGRTLEVQVPRDLPSVACDYAQIEQVLSNLLENAATHTPAGRPITVRAAVAGAHEVRVDVEDSGPGILPAERERLFHPFERGKDTRTSGTGLGLAIALGLVEAHGGRLWIQEAPTPSGGTCFSFTLPLAPPQAREGLAA